MRGSGEYNSRKGYYKSLGGFTRYGGHLSKDGGPAPSACVGRHYRVTASVSFPALVGKVGVCIEAHIYHQQVRLRFDDVLLEGYFYDPTDDPAKTQVQKGMIPLIEDFTLSQLEEVELRK